MKRMIHSVCVVALALAGRALAAPPAEDSIPRVLLDMALKPSVVRLISITSDSIQVRDEAGKPVTYPRSRVAALLPVLESFANGPIELDTSAGLASPPGRLELVSGELLPGRLSTQEAPGEKLAWESLVWGRVEVPLDQAGFVLLAPTSALASRRPIATSDAAILANGDSLEGFVAGLGAKLLLERDHATSELPIDRVVSVSFANPVKPVGGAWAWLHNGSAVSISKIELSAAGDVTIAGTQSPAPNATLRVGELRALVFQSARVVPLSSLGLQIVPSPGERRWTPPALVGDARLAPAFAAEIELPGPMTVRWALPRGAARVGGQAELPPSCRVWGDCELLIGVPGGTPTRVRLNAENPVVSFSVELNAGAEQLEISIDPGPSGPVQDRVVIRRGLVVVGK